MKMNALQLKKALSTILIILLLSVTGLMKAIPERTNMDVMESLIAVSTSESNMLPNEITATPNQSYCPDVWEKAYNIGAVTTGTTWRMYASDMWNTVNPEAEYNLHDNYTLPFPEIPEGYDAVMKFMTNREIALNAYVSDGANGKVALYREDFEGFSGPMADNYYAGHLSNGVGSGSNTAGPVIEELTVLSGTYYLVASSTEPDFEVTISFVEMQMPCPVGVTNVYPSDNASWVEQDLTLYWTLDDHCDEWRLVFSSTYWPDDEINHPQTIITDWSCNLQESYHIHFLLHKNTNYFWRIDQRNNGGEEVGGCTVYGSVFGFTTSFDVPQNLRADNSYNTHIFEGEQNVTLTWDPVQDQMNRRYRIYRNGELYAETPDNQRVTSYTIPSSEFHYNMNNAHGEIFNVTAVYDEGESPMSNSVEVWVNGYAAINGTDQDDETSIANVTIQNGMGDNLVEPTDYLVVSSTGADIRANIGSEEQPCQIAAVTNIYPADNASWVEQDLTLHWTLDDHCNEWRLVFSSTYWPDDEWTHPQTIITDWSCNLQESYHIHFLLCKNTNYFWRIEQRSNPGTEWECYTQGPVFGFTTIFDIPRNLRVDNSYNTHIFEGEQNVTLTWDPVQDQMNRRYRIYRNGVLYAETPDNQPVTSYTIPSSEFNYNMYNTHGEIFDVTAVYDEGESPMSNSVEIWVSGMGSVSGTAYEQDGVTPIGGVTVTLQGFNEFNGNETVTFITDDNGYYEGTIHAGIYPIAVAQKEGYQDTITIHALPLHIIYQEMTDHVDFIMDEVIMASNHWTPVGESLYPFSMTLYGIIQIDGVEQYSDQLELGVFCGDECRGSAIASEFFLTHRYLVEANVYGDSGEQLTFKLYNHATHQELELTPPDAITFTIDGYGNPVSPYVLNFTSSVNITATTAPEGAGTVTGTGEYTIGSSCTLTATANPGFQFQSWTLDGTVVSLNSTYTFTVMGTANYVANFLYVQSRTLVSGWNWWSTYIEQESDEGLTMLENSLGTSGIRIQGKNSSVDYFEYQGTGYWYGALNALANEQMYMIRTSAACDAVVVGDAALPSNHPITINGGWNWIGYPSSQSVDVNVAMSSFTPEANDVVKGRNSVSTYISYGGYEGWYGQLNTLEPGQGYMYRSYSNGSKTLTFQPGRGGETNANITPESNVFVPTSASNYADNMIVTAVIDLEGEELRSEDYELAAFIGNECRGSVKLMYVEPFDRYVALLMAYGEGEEELRFVLTDGQGTSWSNDRVTYTANGMVGTMTNPAVLHFGPLGVEDNLQKPIHVYPNPSKGIFNIEGEGIQKIEVVDIYGQVVLSKEVKNTNVQVDLSDKAAGAYLLRVVTDKGIVTHKLIKNN